MGGYFRLAAEILVDLAHALHLFRAERAAALEMTAVQARVGLHGQPGIVVRGNRAAREGKVVILVHKADVDARRAGLAVAEIHARAGDCVRLERADDGIILLRVGGGEEVEQLVEVGEGLHAGRGHQHAGAVERVLQAPGVRQSRAERGFLGAQAADRLRHSVARFQLTSASAECLK